MKEWFSQSARAVLKGLLENNVKNKINVAISAAGIQRGAWDKEPRVLRVNQLGKARGKGGAGAIQA